MFRIPKMVIKVILITTPIRLTQAPKIKEIENSYTLGRVFFLLATYLGNRATLLAFYILQSERIKPIFEFNILLPI